MTSEPDPERLTRLLGGEDLAWLRERVRRRLRRGRPAAGMVTLQDPTDEQRKAVARLLGRAPASGSSLSVDLAAVDEVLRRSAASPEGLVPAVLALDGPVVDEVAAKLDSARRWKSALEPLEAPSAADPRLSAWWAGVRQRGLVQRLAPDVSAAAALVADTAACLARLPSDGEPIGRFAERVLGSAHALDSGRPLTTLVFSAARVLADAPLGAGATWRREVWAGVGITRDVLSSSVLTLGLPGAGGATGVALGILTESGEPTVLTLRQLMREPPRWRLPGTCVSICENPVVPAVAADRLGPRCAPLVCLQGQPSAAALRLLHLLAAAGAALRFHADFDWGGVRIGNALTRTIPIRPWRYDARTYRMLVVGGAGRALSGRAVPSSWDTGISEALAELGRAVEEEHVLDSLVADLAVTD